MRNLVNDVIRSGAAGVIVLVLASGELAPRAHAITVDQSHALPRPTGTFPVGRQVFYVLDSTRVDPQAIRSDGKREFMLLAWYPAVDDPARTRSSWIPPIWADSGASDLFQQTRSATSPPTISEVREAIKATSSWSLDSASIVPSDHRLPVLIFSPGNFTMPGYYSSLAEEFASHGYVVIGQVPTGYSRNVVLSDGRVFPRRPYRDLDTWTGDLRYILNHLSQWDSDPRHLFHGRLDTLRVGMYGHSGGANAAEMLGASEDRVRAIAAIDPGLTDTAWATRKPTLLLLAENKRFFDAHASEAQAIAGERSAFRRRLAHGFEITILGTEHMSFSDLSAVQAFRSSSEAPSQLAASRSVLLAFFDEALRGVPSELLRKGAHRDTLIRIDG